MVNNNLFDLIKARFTYVRISVNRFLLLVVVSLVSLALTAGERPAGVSKKIVNISTLENIPGKELTAITVELDPGVSVPTHSHAGFVFVYVLEGTVSSQLNNGEVVEFSTGQSWTEPPGTIHSLSYNPSTTDIVKLLAVFVANDGTKLTNFKQINHGVKH